MTAFGDSLCQGGGRGVTDSHDCSQGLTLSGWGYRGDTDSHVCSLGLTLGFYLLPPFRKGKGGNRKKKTWPWTALHLWVTGLNCHTFWNFQTTPTKIDIHKQKELLAESPDMLFRGLFIVSILKLASFKPQLTYIVFMCGLPPGVSFGPEKPPSHPFLPTPTSHQALVEFGNGDRSRWLYRLSGLVTVKRYPEGSQ